MYITKDNKPVTFGQRLKRDVRENGLLYAMITPVIIYVAIFCYGPMYGVILAFKRYRIKDGIWGSKWVGWDNFERFIRSFNFWTLMENTLALSTLSLVVGFFVPIGFALMLNYLRSARMKKTVQLVSYAPHFISVVVVCGMIRILFASNGPLNAIGTAFGCSARSTLVRTCGPIWAGAPSSTFPHWPALITRSTKQPSLTAQQSFSASGISTCLPSNRQRSCC